MLDLYLRERGDTNIKSNADLLTKANYYDEPHFPTPKRGRENAEKDMQYDMSGRLLRRCGDLVYVPLHASEPRCHIPHMPTASRRFSGDRSRAG